VPIIAAAMTTIRIAGDDRGGHDHHSTRAGAEALASRIRRYLAGVTKACALASSERRGHTHAIPRDCVIVPRPHRLGDMVADGGSLRRRLERSAFPSLGSPVALRSAHLSSFWVPLGNQPLGKLGVSMGLSRTGPTAPYRPAKL
jgi:hypothetical protein